VTALLLLAACGTILSLVMVGRAVVAHVRACRDLEDRGHVSDGDPKRSRDWMPPPPTPRMVGGCYHGGKPEGERPPLREVDRTPVTELPPVREVESPPMSERLRDLRAQHEVLLQEEREREAKAERALPTMEAARRGVLP
jgi:hypothetical protein